MAVAVGYTGCIWSHRKILRSHCSWAICLGVRLPTGSSVTKISKGCVSGSCTQLWQRHTQELQPSAVSGVPGSYTGMGPSSRIRGPRMNPTGWWLGILRVLWFSRIPWSLVLTSSSASCGYQCTGSMFIGGHSHQGSILASNMDGPWGVDMV